MDYDYQRQIFDAEAKHGQARIGLRQAEEVRDYAIRTAHRHGGMTVREIASIAGISHQRVAQIVRAP